MARRLPRWAPIPVFVLVVIIYALRRPDIVLNAQFWAEDGRVWFTDAVTRGLWALATPHTGYLQSFSRVTIGLSSLLPWEWSPLFANVVGLIVRAIGASA